MAGDAREQRERIKRVIETLVASGVVRPETILAMYNADIAKPGGWECVDARLLPKHMRVLEAYGIVRCVSECKYGITAKWKLVDRDAVREWLEARGLVPKGEIPVDGSCFEGIVGHDDAKRAILMALRARKPVHVLLIGPPAVGKSLLLDAIVECIRKRKGCVARVEGAKTGLTTAAGIRDVLLELPANAKCVLVIDELDKMNKDDLTVLFRIMETGEIIVTKAGQHIEERRNVWVIAAANRIDRLQRYYPELLSRFAIKLWFRPYTPQEFIRVVTEVLHKREGVDRELAEYIAKRLANKKVLDVRVAIQIGRMAQTKDDVDFLIELVLGKKVGL